VRLEFAINLLEGNIHTGCGDELVAKLSSKLGALFSEGGFNELGELGVIRSTL
jgi:hypothetical protein